MFLVLIVKHETLSQPTITRRVGMTNVTDLRLQWSTAGFLNIALVHTTVTKQSVEVTADVHFFVFYKRNYV